ncbi:hypothetical protein HPB48_002762 [Haemaphysalis longicornis]|uniref:CG-1 domain-containing protein n=1 Tax=Haemaphysalis longicornis TaxID=44386 RepID=A0A9J6GNG3_HAELO|nr:hypothetical protein HPB48_002762 [Haemaphysalis longicornis]
MLILSAFAFVDPLCPSPPFVRRRPKSGSMLLYSRKRVRYRRDGYCWKKRKDGKTTREDHMKLKVQGTEVRTRIMRRPLGAAACAVLVRGSHQRTRQRYP